MNLRLLSERCSKFEPCLGMIRNARPAGISPGKPTGQKYLIGRTPSILNWLGSLDGSCGLCSAIERSLWKLHDSGYKRLPDRPQGRLDSPEVDRGMP